MMLSRLPSSAHLLFLVFAPPLITLFPPQCYCTNLAENSNKETAHHVCVELCLDGRVPRSCWSKACDWQVGCIQGMSKEGKSIFQVQTVWWAAELESTSVGSRQVKLCLNSSWGKNMRQEASRYWSECWSVGLVVLTPACVSDIVE